MAAESDTLEILIHKATNPLNPEQDEEAVSAFSERVNAEFDGPQLALRLLVHKIQSPQEKEALYGLNVLQKCARNCGPKFQSELGKFRFLNELIKLVSPKYLGTKTPYSVKEKTIEILYCWTIDFKHEPKIIEAYDMLKRQKVVKEDPKYIGDPDMPQLPAPSPRPRQATFEDEEKSKLLQHLLQSKNPEDLQAANRLIKTMVKEDERRVERKGVRKAELETVKNNISVLTEMLDNYRPGHTSVEELDLMKELYETCEQLRPKLFRLASEMEDKEEGIGDILKGNDDLGKVINRYTAIFIDGNAPPPLPPKGRSKGGSNILLDLSSSRELQQQEPGIAKELLDNQLEALGLSGDNITSQSSPPSSLQSNGIKSDFTELGDIFGPAAPTVPPLTANFALTTSPTHGSTSTITGITSDILTPLSSTHDSIESNTSMTQRNENKSSKSKALEELDAIGETLLKQSLPENIKPGSQFHIVKHEKIPMNQMKKPLFDSPVSSNPLSEIDLSVLNTDLLEPSSSSGFRNSAGQDLETKSNDSRGDVDLLSVDLNVSDHLSESPSGNDSCNRETDEVIKPSESENRSVPDETRVAEDMKNVQVEPLTDIDVKLDSIKPSSHSPLTVLPETNGVSVTFHFATNSPRPDVSVIVVTVISKNPNPIYNYIFQATVTKGCKVKMQQPSGTELAGYSPFLPPPAITQIMLLANPVKVKVIMKFMMSYVMEEDLVTEVGEVELPFS